MSLVIAEVQDGVVYMGADTLASGDVFRHSVLAESNLKISKMPHGILIGRVGSVKYGQILCCHKDWFDALENEKLTKEFLVMKIIPRLYDALKEAKSLEEKPPARIDGRFFVAQEDRLFRINDDFSVTVISRFNAIGCAAPAALVINELAEQTKDEPIREKFLKSLRLAVRLDNAVGAPFVFIDTKNLEFEFTEE